MNDIHCKVTIVLFSTDFDAMLIHPDSHNLLHPFSNDTMGLTIYMNIKCPTAYTSYPIISLKHSNQTLIDINITLIGFPILYIFG